LHRRPYLSVRPDIRVAGRRTDEIRVEKSYQFPDRPRAISFSPATDDGEPDRIAATHCARHSSNRPDPTQAEQRRTSAHSSVRGKTNAEAAGGAADSTRKAVGHFEEKHRRISRRYRLLAQSYSGPRLFIFSSEMKTSH